MTRIEFWHDLELYEQLASRTPQRRAGRASRAIASGPFVDRVGCCSILR